MIDESGWLIEYHFDNEPRWWTGDYLAHKGQEQWSKDSLQAVRFSRKVDAEMVMVGVLGLKLPCLNVVATEHGWYSP